MFFFLLSLNPWLRQYMQNRSLQSFSVQGIHNNSLHIVPSIHWKISAHVCFFYKMLVLPGNLFYHQSHSRHLLATRTCRLLTCKQNQGKYKEKNIRKWTGNFLDVSRYSLCPLQWLLLFHLIKEASKSQNIGQVTMLLLQQNNFDAGSARFSHWICYMVPLRALTALSKERT